MKRSLLLLLLGLFAACSAKASVANPTSVLDVIACDSDERCGGGLCINGQCRAPCESDDACDSNQLCIDRACTAKVPPTLTFGDDVATTMWVNQPVRMITPTVTPGPQADAAELAFSVILSPPGAPPIEGTEMGAMPRASIEFDPEVPGYYAIEARAHHRGGEAVALLFINVLADTTFAYLERAGSKGVHAIHTDGTVEVLATGGRLDETTTLALAAIDGDRVAYAYHADAGGFAAAPVPPAPASIASETSPGVWACQPGETLLFIDGDQQDEHLCCPDGQSNVIDKQCCPPGFVLRRLLPNEINDPTQQQECVLVAPESALELRVGSPSGRGERSLMIAPPLTEGAGATCAFEVPPDPSTESLCDYSVGNFGAGGNRLYTTVSRGGATSAMAVLRFDLDVEQPAAVLTDSALPPPSVAKKIISTELTGGGTDGLYTSLTVSPNGTRVLLETLGNDTGYVRTLWLLDPENGGSTASLALNVPGLPGALLPQPANAGGDPGTIGRTRYAVRDDGSVVYILLDSFVRISGAHLDNTAAVDAFESSTAGETWLPAAERSALFLCKGLCASTDVSALPAFSDAACDSDDCCTCLKDQGQSHDPAAYCRAPSRGIVAAPTFTAPVISHDGTHVALLRTTRRYDGASCNEIFAPSADIPTRSELLIRSLVDGTEQSIPLTFIPAKTRHALIMGTHWLAEDTQLGFYLEHGDDPEEKLQQLWIVNVDGTRPKQLLPATVSRVGVQTPMCASHESSLVAALLIGVYLLASLRRKRSR